MICKPLAPATEKIDHLIGHLFRHEAGKMAAVLTRMLGTENFNVAEDLVQDTLVKAMETWPFYGIPNNPSAWLYRVAKNRAIDFIRNRQTKNRYEKEYLVNVGPDFEEAFEEDEIKDSVLRMMFACCHPSILPESQIALTLKTLGGLSTSEIAHAFLTNEETIAKRIYRAKEKIRDEKIQLESPGIFDLTNRLNNVLKVLYLIFNEGYYSTDGSNVVREDLCEDAMRFTFALAQHRVTRLPKVKALLSLMCLQASRLDARTNAVGDIVLLEHQDRSKWNKPLIQKGLELLEESSIGEEVSEFHIEAAIASIHSLAPDFKSTRWDKLVVLYDALYAIKPNPMIALGRAIAVGYHHSPSKGLEELDKIESLRNHYLYISAVGNFHLLNNAAVDAAIHFSRAVELAPSQKEKELLQRKLLECRTEPQLN